MNKKQRELLQIKRFKERIVKSSNCWNWIWKKDKDGYGHFHARPRHTRAHRFSYELFVGKIPKGKFVCHSCDNPSCVNPKHLWLGTAKENNRDAMKKGRKIQPNFCKTHCKRGHELNSKNTYVTPIHTRVCIICRRHKIKEWKKNH